MADWLDQAYAKIAQPVAAKPLDVAVPAAPDPLDVDALLAQIKPAPAAPTLPNPPPPRPASPVLDTPEFKPVARESSAMGAGLRSAARNILPGGAGIAAAIPGAQAGAAAGSFAGPVGAAVGGIGGGLLAYWLASSSAHKLQDLGLETFLSPEQLSALEEQRKADTAQHPVATFAGELAPQVVAFRPSISNITKAAAFAKELKAAKDATALLKAAPDKVQNLVNVAFGTGTAAALEATNQIREGKFDPLKAAAAIVSGAVLTDPRFGGPKVPGRAVPAGKPSLQGPVLPGGNNAVPGEVRLYHAPDPSQHKPFTLPQGIDVVTGSVRATLKGSLGGTRSYSPLDSITPAQVSDALTGPDGLPVALWRGGSLENTQSGGIFLSPNPTYAESVQGIKPTAFAADIKKPKVMTYYDSSLLTAEEVAQLKAKGFDSVVGLNIDPTTKRANISEVVVFDKTQLRSESAVPGKGGADFIPGSEIPADAFRASPLTQEAQDFLRAAQNGAPAFVTANLERIARANGVDPSGMNPQQIVDALRAKGASATPPPPGGAGQPPPGQPGATPPPGSPAAAATARTSVSAEKNLSPLSTDAKVVKEIVDPATETYRTQQLPDDVRVAEADARLKTNPLQERDLFYNGRLNPANAVDVEVQKRILTEDGQAAIAAKDTAAITKLIAATTNMREEGSRLSDAFRARGVNDPVGDLMEALLTPSKRLRDAMKGKTGAERQPFIDEHAKEVQDIADEFKAKYGVDIDNLGAVKNDPHAMAELMRSIQIKNASVFDQFYEYWRNAILSAPTTQAANAAGNTLNLGWNYTVQRWTEALLNTVVRDPNSPTFGEVAFLRTRTFKGLRQGAKNAIISFNTEQPFSRGIKLDSSGVAIPGTAGRVVRAPQRVLVAADEFAKASIIDWETASMVYRDAKGKGLSEVEIGKLVDAELANPQSKYRAKAYAEAERLTFQEAPGAFASLVLQARQMPGVAGGLMKFVFPFVSTPINLLRTGLRKSPLGVLSLLKEAATGGYRGKTPLAIRDAAEQVLAYAVGVPLMSMALGDDDDGLPRITGSAPNSNSKNERGFAQTAYPPQSIRLGGKWYSYSRLEPFATSLTPTIDAINALKSKQGDDWTSAASKMFSSLKSTVRDKTFLQGLGGIMKAMEDEKRLGGWVENFAASWIPNFERATLRAMDDNIRDYRNREKGTAAIKKFGQNVVQKALPSTSLGIPVKYDHWGRPVRNNISPFGDATDVLWRLVMPVRVQSETSTTNLDRMVYRWSQTAEANGGEPWYPGVPNRLPKLRMRGVEREMTADERDQYMRRRGEIALARAQKMRWRFDAPTARDMERLQNVFEAAGRVARGELIRGFKPLTPTQA